MSDIGIKELAKHLGISTASVSRALNRPSRVSDSMRKKVRAAAAEMGYRTNMLGSSLRTSKTKNIVAIMPDLSDTFNAGIIASMEAAAADAGYSILFGDSGGSRERELRYGDLVQHKQADGVIFFSPTPPFDDQLLTSENRSVPPMVNSCEVVSTDGFMVRDKAVPYVTIDNVLAAEELVSHLIEIGHTDIAVITGSAGNPSTLQRIEGYRRAHQRAGLPVNEEYIFDGRYEIEAGRAITNEVLALRKRPTAIFCMCDESALGCMHTLHENGLRVPDDIAVAGFDDIRFATYVTPSLTTVAQPVYDIGRHCSEMIIRLIEGKTLDNPKMVLPHKLVVRASTIGAKYNAS